VYSRRRLSRLCADSEREDLCFCEWWVQTAADGFLVCLLSNLELTVAVDLMALTITSQSAAETGGRIMDGCSKYFLNSRFLSLMLFMELGWLSFANLCGLCRTEFFS